VSEPTKHGPSAEDLEFAKSMGLEDLAPLDPTVGAPIGAEEVHQKGHSVSAEGGRSRGRYQSKWDKGHVWKVYLQCQGRIDLMIESGHPGIPTSKKTLVEYVRNHGFEQRLQETIAKDKPEEVSSLAQAANKRLDQLRKIEEGLFELLTPQIDPKNPAGPKIWPLKPEKFEATISQFLKLVERIEVMSGGVTSRTEVRSIVKVNFNLVCATFGQVVNESIQSGDLTQRQARKLIDSFRASISKKDIVLDPNYVEVKKLSNDAD
jgi:hypothetical protein